MIEILLLPMTIAAGLALLALGLAAVFFFGRWLSRFQSTTAAEIRETGRAAVGGMERIERGLREELARGRQESAFLERQGRDELRAGLGHLTDALLKRMGEIARLQKDQLDSFARQLAELTALNEAKIEGLRGSLEQGLRALNAGTAEQLEEMRRVVDEKLQSTLDRRLGESFRQVSERLEQVYAGLGEMRTLAVGVGDLKKVLTNVKTRGGWGEIQLGRLLEQVLAPDQFAVNVATKPGSPERVEFAVRLPGPDRGRQEAVWLPIDAKFPQEDYQRLLEAQEAADRERVERSLRSLELRLKAEAKAVQSKYVDPPHTTDFALLFLPVEGLYAEALRIPGLCEHLQREYRVVVAGPSTLAALLNSLQMGFRTLAIEKRSSVVWELLGTVRTEFGKFGDALTKTKRKIQEAAQSIDQAEVRTRAIERSLSRVEAAPLDPAAREFPEAS